MEPKEFVPVLGYTPPSRFQAQSSTPYSGTSTLQSMEGLNRVNWGDCTVASSLASRDSHLNLFSLQYNITMTQIMFSASRSGHSGTSEVSAISVPLARCPPPAVFSVSTYLLNRAENTAGSIPRWKVNR